jgi:cytidylate kinase
MTSSTKIAAATLVVAIDGPAGSGKSTTAKLVAARLGFQFLDTGAMYRALTVIAHRTKTSISDGDALTSLAKSMRLHFQTTETINRVLVNGEDLTEAIRTPEVTRDVSEVSAHRGVREIMVAQQRALGLQGRIVAEGRDTTTVVFPQAGVKIFLIANVATRAVRRLRDLERAGHNSSIDAQVADLERRDAYDSGREVSPLTQAPDAIAIDTTELTIEEQVTRIIELARDRFQLA